MTPTVLSGRSAIAPFHVLLLPINYRDKAIQAASDRLYQQLQKRGVEVLLDDRDERPGVKFKDADLVGIPLRLTVGAKGLEKDTVELRGAATGKLTKSRWTTRRKQSIASSPNRFRHRAWHPTLSWFVPAYR